MSLDQAKKVIDEIATIGGKYIQPSIYTEPFANQDLKDIVLYCNEKKIGMSIISNGVLIDEEWIEFILKYMTTNYTISFSLDAVEQATYEKVRSKNVDLLKLEHMIIDLVNRRRGKFPRIGVSFGIEEDNWGERDKFLNKWKDIVDAVRIDTCFNDSRKIPEKFLDKNFNKNIICTRLFEVMTIDFDGSVRVCQADAFGDSYIGNIFTEGILNVWRGKNFKELRERHKNNRLMPSDFCYECEAGKMVLLEEEETKKYIIKKGQNMLFYNKK